MTQKRSFQFCKDILLDCMAESGLVLTEIPKNSRIVDCRITDHLTIEFVIESDDFTSTRPLPRHLHGYVYANSNN